MSNVYELPERKDPLEEASGWLAKLDRGMDAQTHEALRAWLAADPKNAAVLMEVARLWDKMDTLSRLADLFPRPVYAPRGPRRVIWAVAASMMITLTAALWGVVGDRVMRPPLHEQVYRTAVGESSTIGLPDGSRLILNTDSVVRVDFTEKQRMLVLERGEVHVQVAHEKARPLSVRVGDRIVEAVGTTFNVKITEGQRIELIVTEGKVLVGVIEQRAPARQEPRMQSAPASAMVVVAGELVMLNDDDVLAQAMEPADIEVKLAWRGGKLVFRGESLADALAEIERYTPVEFVIQDEDLKKVRVVGMFKAGDVDGLLSTLRQNFNIAYQRVGDKEVILRSKAAQQ